MFAAYRLTVQAKGGNMQIATIKGEEDEAEKNNS